jgi:hypothetical protein
MTFSNPTDTQHSVKQTHKRGRSVTEKQHQLVQRVQRQRSNAAGTAKEASARENNRQAMQRSRASK